MIGFKAENKTNVALLKKTTFASNSVNSSQ